MVDMAYLRSNFVVRLLFASFLFLLPAAVFVAGFHHEDRMEECANVHPKAAKFKYKIAIAFFGLSRNLTSTLPSIEHHVYQPLWKNNIAYDVFWHTLVTRRVHLSREPEDGYIDPFDVETMNPCIFSLSNQESVRSREFKLFAAARNMSVDKIIQHKQFDNWNDGYISVHNILSAYYTQADLAHMISVHAQLLKRTYDAILVLRPDTAIMRDIDLPQKLPDILAHPDWLWVPDFQHWGGYNDRAAFGSYRVMLKYLNRGAVFRDSPHTTSGERMLKYLESRQYWTVQMSNMRVLRIRQNGCLAMRDTPSNLNITMPDKDFIRCIPNMHTKRLSRNC
mmetsp:Transcript_10454/g.17062  ORF Transcript_10454/g.17062 Transcript_10454/m.17062 type:complete len:336 (-) Transcript_10454:98-1105(-)